MGISTIIIIKIKCYTFIHIGFSPTFLTHSNYTYIYIYLNFCGSAKINIPRYMCIYIEDIFTATKFILNLINDYFVLSNSSLAT